MSSISQQSRPMPPIPTPTLNEVPEDLFNPVKPWKEEGAVGGTAHPYSEVDGYLEPKKPVKVCT